MEAPPKPEPGAKDGFPWPSPKTQQDLKLSILEDGQLEGVIVTPPTSVFTLKSVLIGGMNALFALTLVAGAVGLSVLALIYCADIMGALTSGELGGAPSEAFVGLSACALIGGIALFGWSKVFEVLNNGLHRAGGGSLWTEPRHGRMPFALDRRTLRLGREVIALSQVLPANTFMKGITGMPHQQYHPQQVTLQVGLRDGTERELVCHGVNSPTAAIRWLHRAIVYRAEAFGSPDDIPESLQHMRDSSAPDK